MLYITENQTFGQLYVSEGDQEIRIPHHRVQKFLQMAQLTQGQEAALHQGATVKVFGKLYNFVDLAG